MVSGLTQQRQDILDEYFLAKAQGKLESTGPGCDWCERFIELKFTCCLNCGYIIEAIE